MISNEISDLIFNKIKENDLVIDIGGGRFPYFRANYILDKRKFDERVGKTAFGGRAGEKEYFSKNTWISRDFYDLPWPFEDNFFNFSLCMGTLEDIRDPIIICKEIQRISKAGYISTPTRAAESKMWVSKDPRAFKLYGYCHHRWFVEIVDSKLVFKMKHPLLYQNKKWLIKELGQHTLNFFWQDNFDCGEQYLGSIDDILKDMENFYHKHNKWLDIIKTDCLNNLTQYNNWPKDWGVWPNFLNMDNYTKAGSRDYLKRMMGNIYQSFNQ